MPYVEDARRISDIPGKTIQGDFDLLGHSVSREGAVYAQLAYNRCIFFVPGPDVGGTLEKSGR